MKNSTRIKLAALATALFVGGLAAFGLAVGRDEQQTASATTASVPRDRVIHRTKVRRVPAKRPAYSAPAAADATPPAAPPAPAPAPAVAQPAVAAAPEQVTSRVSPTGSGGEEEDEPGEEAEHEVGDE